MGTRQCWDMIYGVQKYEYLKHGYVITYCGSLWCIITCLCLGDPIFAHGPLYQCVANKRVNKEDNVYQHEHNANL